MIRIIFVVVLFCFKKFIEILFFFLNKNEKKYFQKATITTTITCNKLNDFSHNYLDMPPVGVDPMWLVIWSAFRV